MRWFGYRDLAFLALLALLFVYAQLAPGNGRALAGVGRSVRRVRNMPG